MTKEYEPLRVQINLKGKRDAFDELILKIKDATKNCQSDRFQFKCSIKELPRSKPVQQNLEVGG